MSRGVIARKFLVVKFFKIVKLTTILGILVPTEQDEDRIDRIE